jgi:hypothetical protein
MFDLKISISGIPELKEKLEKIEPLIYEENLEVMENAVKYAKAFAPEDTGRLENSIRLEQESETEISIIADPVDENGRHYAEANEYGSYSTPLGDNVSTSGKICTRPFVRPAIELAMTGFEIGLDKKFRESGLQ